MSASVAEAFGQEPERRRSGRKLFYVLAAVDALAAVVLAIVWSVTGFTGLGDAVNELQRVPVPGQAVVTLEAGKNAVYYEGRGNPGVRLALRKVDGGAVEIGPHGGDVTYDADGHSGHSIAGFTLDDAGDYELTVRGEAPPGAVVAVGKGIGGRIVRAIVGGLAIFFGGLLLCGLLIILGARRPAA